MNLEEVSLLPIREGDDFWLLMDEVAEDEIFFKKNRNKLLFAFKEGKLFGLTFGNLKEEESRNIIFCRNGSFHLPAISIFENETISLLWIHRRVHNLGLGKIFVRLLME